MLPLVTDLRVRRAAPGRDHRDERSGFVVVTRPPGQLCHLPEVPGVHTGRQAHQVAPPPDAIRLRLEGRDALSEQRPPFPITSHRVNDLLDLELHLQQDSASVLGDRGHIIQVPAQDPLLQPHLGDRNPQAVYPIPSQQGGQDHGRYSGCCQQSTRASSRSRTQCQPQRKAGVHIPMF